MGDRGHPALSTYDMGSIGLGGCVSAKGWVEIHDPASASISIKMFAMGNCVSRSQSSKDEDFPEMSDLSEFKAAIRVLRGAMAYVHPWNRSIDALENFLIQSNFGGTDLAGVAKPAAFLSQFTDYVLVENASRWRGMEPFLSTRDLRNTWVTTSARSRPQSARSRRPTVPATPNSITRSHTTREASRTSRPLTRLAISLLTPVRG